MNGTVRLAPLTNIRAAWRTVASFFGLGSHHDPRSVAEKHEGQIVGIAQLHESAGLVGPVGRDGPGEVVGIVGDHAYADAAHCCEIERCGGSCADPLFGPSSLVPFLAGETNYTEKFDFPWLGW